MHKQLIGVVMICGALAMAAAAEDTKTPTAAEQVAIIEALQPSLVRVEYTLQMDKGQAPVAAGWRERCSGCGEYHVSNATGVIDEERPLEAAGFVLSPTEILVADPMIHSRFVKKIEVRFGEQVVVAAPQAYGVNQTAMVLKLAKPLDAATPLAFDKTSEPPFMAVTAAMHNGAWTVSIKGLSTTVATTVDGRKFRMAPSYCLIVDAGGKPVGMTMNDELPIDESWRGSPASWEMVSATDLAAAIGELEKTFAQSVVRVALSFRSPKKDAEPQYRYSRGGEESGTEQNVLGAIIDTNRVLVLASLTAKVTARLERIMVHRPGAEPVAATFTHTLSNYGAFIATLESPVEGAITASSEPITAWRNQLLLAADVELQGEKCTTYFMHSRIPGFDVGYKRRIFPQISGDTEKTVLFDRQGRLVAFPAVRRPKAGQDESWRTEYPTTTPVGHFTAFLYGDMADEIDPNNVPLTEEQEARLAWLGVELQRLNQELARINKVSHLTQDGRTGGMVSYVHAGSPAAEAGLEAGDILLRLHVPDQPKPIEIEGDEAMFGGQAFPWDRYDEFSEQIFDRIPRPWPPAGNAINKVLTDVGFGKPFEVEFVRDGEVTRKPFTVVQCPAHYDMAPKFKEEGLGVTVRDLTYEVRRYFLRRPDDPGVILAIIEPGSRASVSGMKPYEIITHVNNVPVMNVADFERLVGQPGDLELSIKRMTKGRVVRIKRKAPGADTEAEETAAPAE